MLLRYPRSPEYFWTLQTDEGPRKMMVSGRFDTDDGDALRDDGWVVDHTVDRILPPAADASIQFKNRGIALIDR